MIEQKEGAQDVRVKPAGPPPRLPVTVHHQGYVYRLRASREQVGAAVRVDFKRWSRELPGFAFEVYDGERSKEGSVGASAWEPVPRAVQIVANGNRVAMFVVEPLWQLHGFVAAMRMIFAAIEHADADAKQRGSASYEVPTRERIIRGMVRAAGGGRR